MRRKALFSAVEAGNLEQVAQLIAEGVDINAIDDNPDYGAFNAEYPIHRATRKGNLEMIKLLVEHGANVNARRNFGKNPLYEAVLGGYLEMVEMISKDTEGKQGKLLESAMTGYLELAKTLVRGETELSALSDHEARLTTPLHDACKHGHFEIARYLLSHGAEIDARSEFGDTPLHAAAAAGRQRIVQLLINHKADLNAVNRDYQTPLYLAAHCHQMKIVDLLAQHGAVISADDHVAKATARPRLKRPKLHRKDVL